MKEYSKELEKLVLDIKEILTDVKVTFNINEKYDFVVIFMKDKKSNLNVTCTFRKYEIDLLDFNTLPPYVAREFIFHKELERSKTNARKI